jgi:hypothetical protein
VSAQLSMFEQFDAIVAPPTSGRYQHAAVIFTALGGKRQGELAAWPVASTVQCCECDCEDCEFLGHCSTDPCGFNDVLPDTALQILEYIRGQQRSFGVEVDARFAWRRLQVGPWEDA